MTGSWLHIRPPDHPRLASEKSSAGLMPAYTCQARRSRDISSRAPAIAEQAALDPVRLAINPSALPAATSPVPRSCGWSDEPQHLGARYCGNNSPDLVSIDISAVASFRRGRLRISGSPLPWAGVHRQPPRNIFEAEIEPGRWRRFPANIPKRQSRPLSGGKTCRFSCGRT